MKHPKVALLQHAPGETGGIIEDEVKLRGIPFERIEIFSTHEIPPLSATHLIVMGGEMSVNDERELPWLIQEKHVIRDFVRKGSPVLGICLGAQMIAASGGAKVTPCEQELGWSPVFSVLPRNNLVPERFMAFQMHGETFGIPDVATLICRGDRVLHQAVAWRSALGLQFHLELTRDMISDWIDNRSAAERKSILGSNPNNLLESQKICRQLAGRFLAAPPTGFSWIGGRDQRSFFYL